MGSDPIGHSRLWLKVERDSDVGGVKVWRGYGWQTALSTGGKSAEMCFSADISSIGCTICDCYYKCFYDTHHQPDEKRDEGCGQKERRKAKWMEREWENEEHENVKNRRNKKVEGLELKWDGGWVIWSETQRLKGITPKK